MPKPTGVRFKLDKSLWDNDEPIDMWFELSYAQYLTVPRRVLTSMPVGWQKRFAKCLFELDEAIDWRPKEGRYWVRLKDGKGRFVYDPLMEYRHKPPLAIHAEIERRMKGEGER